MGHSYSRDGKGISRASRFLRTAVQNFADHVVEPKKHCTIVATIGVTGL